MIMTVQRVGYLRKESHSIILVG